MHDASIVINSALSHLSGVINKLPYILSNTIKLDRKTIERQMISSTKLL